MTTRRLLSSTVARLVLAIFALQLMASAAAIVLLRSQMVEVVNADRTRQVIDVRDDLLAAFYDGGRAELEEVIGNRRGSAGDPLIFIALSDGAAPVLSNVAALPAGVPTGRPAPVTVRQRAGAAASEGIAVATQLPDGATLVVGASTATDRRFDLAFAEAVGLTVTLAVVLALGSALALGLVISRRTHAIAETAQALGSGDFAARVSGEYRGDGFDHLREQMNRMAERIDRLVGQLHSVSAALAHDLQSPVARLRASLETAASRVPEGPGLEALQGARADAEALQAMLAAALELGRLESGTVADRRAPLELGEVAADLVELYEPLAEQSGAALEIAAAPARVLGDRELLSRALANLIDNALKYGGKRIAVTLATAGGMAELAVRDDGPGIDAGERARAVEPFTRLDNARTSPGAGLGLAMVAAVAQLHGGELELGAPSRGRGLVAAIRIPLL